MKKIVTFLILAFTVSLAAQAQAQPGYCGTPAYKSEWLQRYQQNPQVVNRSMMPTLYVPITIHLVGRNDGTGHLPADRLLNAFCQLNEDFEQAAIQFYIKGNIRYINNSNYYEHDFGAGAQMMDANNVPNTVNCYFVDDPAGNCGYYHPTQDGVAINRSCLGANDHTWAHEVGHYLDLPHTFYGWEGTTYDYNSPTPSSIGGSFFSVPVEKVNGSNCRTASDGFCDTPPDYLSGLWGCNASSESPQIQKDPSGVEFRSDGSLFMSYATDCQSRFSDEQISAMRANLEQQRPGHLANQTPPPSLGNIELDPIFPAEGATLQNGEAFTLRWQPIAGARLYLVEVSRLPTFSFTEVKFATTATALTVAADALFPDNRYFWRIRPFNGYDGCTGYSDVHSFAFSALTSSTATQETVQGLRLFPNPAGENQEVFLEFASGQAGAASVSLLSLAGQELRLHRLDMAPGMNRMRISTAGLPKGLYVLRVDANGGANYRKLMVQ